MPRAGVGSRSCQLKTELQTGQILIAWGLSAEVDLSDPKVNTSAVNVAAVE
jgi:hypothetical protein